MTTAGFPPFKTAQLTSSSIQLSSIPEKLIIFARRIPSSLTPMDAESYLVIRDIRVNFNTSSGLLSTFTQQQLYEASISSGLTDLTWENSLDAPLPLLHLQQLTASQRITGGNDMHTLGLERLRAV